MIFEPGEPQPGPPTRAGCVVAALLAAAAGTWLVTAVQKTRDASSRLACLGRHCQLALGLHMYAGDHPPALPPGTVPHPDLSPDRRLSWYVAVLPYFDEGQRLGRIDSTSGWDDPVNAAVTATPLNMAVCPPRRRDNLGPICFTAGVAGVGPDAAVLPAGHPRAGVFGFDRGTALDRFGIPDGTAHTLLLLEDGRGPGPWARGGEATVRGLDPAAGPPGALHRQADGWSYRPFVTLGAMADGSTRTFTADAAPAVLAALATAAGGESLPE